MLLPGMKLLQSKTARAFIFLLAALVFSGRAAAGAEHAVLDITSRQAAAATGTLTTEIVTVTLKGKVSLFGYKDFFATVKDVRVRIAEFPESKDLNVRSGDDGWWALDVRKYRDIPAEASFVYEKKGWVTTKSNAITIGDSDNTDIAIQYVDPPLYYGVVKPLVEKALPDLMPGAKPELTNAMVVTVGKKWASMHDGRLPHGDPGATVTTIEGAIGPVYFDESVKPNPSYKKTSVDGGVTWINVPPGTYYVTAFKEGVEYPKVKFVVEETDAENGILLYIASPPDSVMGSNESGPREF